MPGFELTTVPGRNFYRAMLEWNLPPVRFTRLDIAKGNTMSQTPNELKYASSHEWARLEEDGTVSVGISDHAQEALGDVVFVELPEVGTVLAAGDDAGVVESVKAASDIYAPVGGEVIGINEKLEDEPEMVNSDPYNDGWFFKLQPSDANELEALLSAGDYQQQCDEED